jgi:hypothetical protein
MAGRVIPAAKNVAFSRLKAKQAVEIVNQIMIVKRNLIIF